MKEIAIYLDRGVSKEAFYKTVWALKGFVGKRYFVRAVNHHYFLQPNWEEVTSLLVIPGGRDLPYHSLLQGEGNRRIALYIETGGRYLGICAGGYYGARFIEFARGQPEEIIAERQLGFYPGIARGPAYLESSFQYHTERGARSATLSWKGGITQAYFNGGCYFVDVENYPAIEVLARYNDLPSTPASVILCPNSQGFALLCGVHPEFNPNHFWHYLLEKLLQ